MRRVITDTDARFIRKNYLLLSSRKIGEKLGHPRGTIMSFLKSNGLKIPRAIALKWKAEAIKELHDRPQPEDEMIKQLYLDMPEKTLAKRVGRSDTFVRTRMRRLNLVVPPELIEKRKQDSYIKKGNVPPNKGKKQVDYMSAEQIERTKATRFQKGGLPGNTTYDGCIRIRHDHPERNGGRPTKYIRLGKAKWLELQKYNWEKVNGPVPDGYILACLDGDTLNCEPSNWELITRKDNMKRNSGCLNLPDNYVAHLLAGKKNKHMKEDYINNPELLDLKRKQLQLKKTIREKRKDNREGKADGQ